MKFSRSLNVRLVFWHMLFKMKMFWLSSLTATLLPLTQAHAAALTLDPKQSKIEVAVTATVDSFVGQLEKYQADINCTPTAHLPTTASVTFDFKDLKTGNPSRDTEMLGWLDYKNNPAGSFMLNNWKTLGTNHWAEGALTIHGVKKIIAMPVTITVTGANWNIAGSADINYRDYDLPIIRKMLLLTVAPHLHITFNLTGTLATK
jgi:polyisoprenoid-binding protein YceI